MGKIRVGISGWVFPGWRGTFYPKGLPHRKELTHASHAFNSLEINSTFYSLQRPETFQNWYNQTPSDFVFAVKAPQYMTHVHRLKEVEGALSNFLASGVLCLGEKLGPILWQFPPYVTLKDDRFERFLEILPKTAREAAKVSKKHSPKLKDRVFTEAKGDFELRHAFEFRHPSFQTPAFLELLRKHGAALVLAHRTDRWPFLEELTAGFTYARCHGEGWKRGYPHAQIETLASMAETWKSHGDVFCYFSVDAKVYSPRNALSLIERLK